MIRDGNEAEIFDFPSMESRASELDNENASLKVEVAGLKAKNEKLTAQLDKLQSVDSSVPKKRAKTKDI